MGEEFFGLVDFAYDDGLCHWEMQCEHGVTECHWERDHDGPHENESNCEKVRNHG